MRYNDNRIFPKLRNRMNDWIHADMSASHKHKDIHVETDKDEDDNLAWRQYIL